MKNFLLTVILDIEIYCQKNDISHRFVGSVSYGGLLNRKTNYKIDIEKKVIILSSHNKLTLQREDNSIRDIDVILFCKEKEKIHKLQSYIQELKTAYSLREGGEFPLISVEAAIYPSFGKRNKLLQFVTALEANENDQLFLVFDDIKQPISWNSVEPWTVVLDDKTAFTTRNPIADYFAYQFRVPSGIRPKDEEKVFLLQRLVNEVVQKGKKYRIDYLSDNYYRSWQVFSEQLKKTHIPSVIFKRELSKYYWQTIGTYLAHGKGAGKLFLSVQNQFTGIKQ